MGQIPLYKHEGMNEMLDGANAGLWYNKFCNQWNQDFEKLIEPKNQPGGKENWIKTVTGKPLGNPSEIELSVKRMKSLADRNSGNVLLFKTDGRFVTGLGLNHPVENGFTWHHTLGTPYIPGTSVKGVVRAFARLLCEEGKAEEKDINIIFGPDDRKEKSNVGTVIFMDAIPVKPVILSADIMTPHYVEYYSSEGREIPGDWDNPNPIPFLTVDTGQEFLFGLIPRNKEAKKDREMVEKWLIEALEWSGAGAKTNVGYGRFIHIKIKSPAENWLVETSEEFGIDLTKITSNPTKDVISKWNDIEDKEFKMDVAIILKNRIIQENNWDGKRWGQLDRLKKALKQYLGE